MRAGMTQNANVRHGTSCSKIRSRASNSACRTRERSVRLRVRLLDTAVQRHLHPDRRLLRLVGGDGELAGELGLQRPVGGANV